jgi:hypothetical protein
MIKKFEYKGKQREAYVLEENDVSIKCIDLSVLTEDMGKDFSANLAKIKSNPKEYLNPYMTAFRHFKKEGMSEPLEVSELPD